MLFRSKSGGILSWDEFMSKGDGEEAPLEKRIQELKPGKCCTLIYTSGTTG
jgi:long-chain-fatty-acid--CoA ligase ACSBG